VALRVEREADDRGRDLALLPARIRRADAGGVRLKGSNVLIDAALWAEVTEAARAVGYR
jgi:hypothetical protein